ncbi:MAG: FAD-dependent oxidoreductase [Planctomycetaceae bacterium]|jgi:uncharacterized protein with NAD-binding domain and iron-sulfur cluster|nr:FAD-dependent oxidoreductase [Planctomycetaceae bacterium]
MRRSLAIVGGGLAGIAAAEAAVRRGFEVDLFEWSNTLGGKAASIYDPVVGDWIDNGQHVALGCCKEFLSLNERLGLGDFFERRDFIPFAQTGGKRWVISPTTFLPATWQLLPAFLRIPLLTFRQRISMAMALRKLGKINLDANRKKNVTSNSTESTQDEFFSKWLKSENIPAQCIEKFWEPLILSSLCDTIENVAFDAVQKIVSEGFLAGKNGLTVHIPKKPLRTIYHDEVSAKLKSMGVNLHFLSRVTALRWEFLENRINVTNNNGADIIDTINNVVNVTEPDTVKVDDIYCNDNSDGADQVAENNVIESDVVSDANIADEVDDKVADEVGGEVDDKVADEVDDKVTDNVDDKVADEADDKIVGEVDDKVVGEVESVIEVERESVEVFKFSGGDSVGVNVNVNVDVIASRSNDSDIGDNRVPVVTGLEFFGGGVRSYDRYILAVPAFRVREILELSELESYSDSLGLSGFEPGAITSVHLWLDSCLLSGDCGYMALVGGLGQFLFCPRQRVKAGVNGFYHVVIISASHRLLSELELSSVGASVLVERVMRQLAATFKGNRQPELLHYRVTTYFDAVFSPHPLVYSHRPFQGTPFVNLAFAGDWTMTGWPATLEGAVRSGLQAIDAIDRDKK